MILSGESGDTTGSVGSVVDELLLELEFDEVLELEDELELDELELFVAGSAVTVTVLAIVVPSF